MKQKIGFCLLVFASLLLGACRDNDSSTQKIQQQTLVVKPTPTHNTLYFSGNLLPYKINNITSPLDGTIEAMHFDYGQIVKKDETLVLINSSKAHQDFESALTEYLKAKQDLNHATSTYKSTQSLYKHELVSRDEYTQAQSAYYLSRLSLLQSQMKLKKSAQYFPSQKKIFSLTLNDIGEINKTFNTHKNISRIPIDSPSDGIALFPTQSDSGGSSSDSSGGGSKKIHVGSQVKQGQLLLSIGTPNGLSLQAKANEVEINELKTGLAAKITSIAFPGITLQGKITSIDYQATDSQSLPEFSLTITIPNVPANAQKLIRIGMSAKASVDIQGPPAIQIPINAVKQNPKTGDAQVTVIGADGKTTTKTVVTGKTSMDSVIIESGLTAGDKIVY
ncbi:MAG: hypothetical protein COV52_01245 [Gammaproteobacteria bacterium CG11_big_fil_rev_8_21_14_0_20_46_22]|nr:MAG: hypothetical protein COW05_02425 [Gammaproteobacteria bacterium CG12_big_fil_rev_8_21_14_0_65_46_12]PIR11954.1 MAG: hypothetical protein COV52_01245 [Gammaproteobacteria bacterium CG11_big_fil_rev_8_21_14_0_20_46_22]